MALTLLRSGLCSVQSSARQGFEAIGVSLGGAADQQAAQLANALVANALDAAVLEICLRGPRLYFEQDGLISLSGAQVQARLDEQPCPLGRPVPVRAGQVLSIERFHRGSMAYLACAGGIAVPEVLGSRSTDLQAGFGGHQGRYLRAGDRLELGLLKPIQERLTRISAPTWWCALELPLSNSVLRMTCNAPCPALAETRWRVSPDSTRMGLSLEGPALELALPEQISAGVVPGVIQLPRSGRPWLLGADAQTIGGYPVLGCVISADLRLAAQLRPGEWVTLAPASLTEARHLALRTRAGFARMVHHLQERLSEAAHGKTP